MFDFYTAAQRQKQVGQRVRVPRPGYRLKTQIVMAILLLLWGGALAVAGGYAHQLWRLWFAPAHQPESREEAPFRLTAQHYFFKKQPLPELIMEPDEADFMDNEEIVEEQVEPSVNAREGSGKEALRARVKKAIEALNEP